MPRRGNWAEVLTIFLRLGCISFGGPVAHLGYFHEELVRWRKWQDEATYADLVALCQFLPRPASSKVAYTIGLRRAVCSWVSRFENGEMQETFLGSPVDGRGFRSVSLARGIRFSILLSANSSLSSLG
jgi:hypothetical protein